MLTIFIIIIKARISTSSFQIASVMTTMVTIIAIKRLAIILTTAILITTQQSQ